MTILATPVAPPPAPRLRPVRYEPGPDEVATAGVRRSAPPQPPLPPPPAPADDGAARQARHVLRLALEMLDGLRPAAHLAGHLEPSALRYLRAAATLRRRDAPGRLTSMRLCRPLPGVAEVAAVYRCAGRSRALAARFERRDAAAGAWRCVVLRLV